MSSGVFATIFGVTLSSPSAPNDMRSPVTVVLSMRVPLVHAFGDTDTTDSVPSLPSTTDSPGGSRRADARSSTRIGLFSYVSTLSPTRSVPSGDTLTAWPSSVTRVRPAASDDASPWFRIRPIVWLSTATVLPSVPRIGTGRPVRVRTDVTARSFSPPAAISATFVKPAFSSSPAASWLPRR
ncbi:hypothetical protein BDO18943_05435 [Burkholderia dolosa]|nr:hypothetical protein BDO18943_05435 [Burkholderia dolosa]